MRDPPYYKLALTPGCVTTWTGHRKLIGMRFLFPPLSDELSLLDKARVWVARHEHKYFVGWTQAELDRMDPLLRPLTTITSQMYKLHMNRWVGVAGRMDPPGPPWP